MRYQTKLLVDLGRLAKNVEKIKALCPNNKILFMAKGNAYGHGMTQVVRFAVTRLGINEFAVASLGEAMTLRNELSELNFDIYVFSDTNLEFQSCAEYYLKNKIMPLIANFNDLEYLLSNPEFADFPICIKFNTGMNRLGFNKSDLEKLIAVLKKFGRFEIYHVVQHFATSSAPITEGCDCFKQYELFKAMKKIMTDGGIKIKYSSAANSGAIEQGFALQETHVRPGIILYGPTSMDKEYRGTTPWDGESISRLETCIVSVMDVKKGMKVSYGGRVIPADGVIAHIALGYADGFNGRMHSPTIRYKNMEGRLFGRVNMDVSPVYFEGASSSDFTVTDSVSIWGFDSKEILQFADEIDAIPYELYCGLTSRVPRIYEVK